MKRLLLFSLISIAFYQTCTAQNTSDRKKIITETNVERLKILSNQFRQSFELYKSASVYKPTIVNRRSETGYFSGFDKKGNPIYCFNENINAAKTSRTNKIWTGGITGLNLDGSAIQIGHWEAQGIPLRHHQELEGRIIRGDTVFTSSHATHTAGTMIGTGINPLARGMASGASIIAYDTEDGESELIDFAIQGGILSNHSYRKGDPDGDYEKYGVYNQKAAEWDEILYNAPYLVICKSAGNERNDDIYAYDNGFDLMYSVSVSKNLLTIGAVDDVEKYTSPSSAHVPDYSSYGPTDDWRIKPDIMANGVDLYSADGDANDDYRESSGTSMACAATTGTIALLQQHYHNRNNFYMKSATVRALLIASADELGKNDGPDFVNGWGLLNAERAAEIISNNGNTSLIRELSLNTNETYSTDIEVDGTTPLSITLAWTDPAGIYLGGYDNLNPMLVNDLDIRLLGNETTYKPWVFIPNQYSKNFEDAPQKGDNERDNVEKIDCKEIPSGKYTVLVSHKGVLQNNKQNFSLVINGILGNLVSAPEISKPVNVSIFPNPVSGNDVSIVVPDHIASKKYSIQLYNAQGQLFRNKTCRKKRIILNTTGLNKGIYFVRIYQKQQLFSHAIVIN